MPNLAFGAHKVVTGLSRSVSSSSSISSASSFSSSDNDSTDNLFGTSPTSSISSSETGFGTPPPAYSPPSPTSPAYDLELQQHKLHLPTATSAAPENVLTLLFPAEHAIHSSPLTFLGAGTIVHTSATGRRTLYTLPAPAFDRDAVCDLLEQAEDHGCTGVVLALAKGEDALGERLHELMYVGGVVLPLSGAFPEWVLVGLDV